MICSKYYIIIWQSHKVYCFLVTGREAIRIAHVIHTDLQSQEHDFYFIIWLKFIYIFQVRLHWHLVSKFTFPSLDMAILAVFLFVCLFLFFVGNRWKCILSLPVFFKKQCYLECDFVGKWVHLSFFLSHPTTNLIFKQMAHHMHLLIC